MKTIISSFIYISLFSVSAFSMQSNEYWQCIAEDESKTQWSFSSEYKKEAINKAYDDCKKQSQDPKTCRTAETLCDYIINGHSSKPIWQCTAIDQNAEAWNSNFYANKNDAALAAKAYCENKSKLPASCYINLLSCKNLNE